MAKAPQRHRARHHASLPSVVIANIVAHRETAQKFLFLFVQSFDLLHI